MKGVSVTWCSDSRGQVGAFRLRFVLLLLLIFWLFSRLELAEAVSRTVRLNRRRGTATAAAAAAGGAGTRAAHYKRGSTAMGLRGR